MEKPFRFIAELLTLGESQVSVMTTISKESEETVPDSSSILLTIDLELDRNKKGKKVYGALLLNLIFRRLQRLLYEYLIRDVSRGHACRETHVFL